MDNLGAFFHRSRDREPGPKVMAAAHGRVNLIGEHTDYHQGFVLPMPIPQRTIVTVQRRTDYLVRASSTAVVPGVAEYELGDGIELWALWLFVNASDRKPYFIVNAIGPAITPPSESPDGT